MFFLRITRKICMVFNFCVQGVRQIVAHVEADDASCRNLRLFKRLWISANPCIFLSRFEYPEIRNSHRLASGERIGNFAQNKGDKFPNFTIA